jgi:hypothetical protein
LWRKIELHFAWIRAPNIESDVKIVPRAAECIYLSRETTPPPEKGCREKGYDGDSEWIE